jgi:hypothetical protein
MRHILSTNCRYFPEHKQYVTSGLQSLFLRVPCDTALASFSGVVATSLLENVMQTFQEKKTSPDLQRNSKWQLFLKKSRKISSYLYGVT